jgi:hypothetical protein
MPLLLLTMNQKMAIKGIVNPKDLEGESDRIRDIINVS